MSKLTGKVAIVTGASKGIGAGIAKSLGAEGASVVVNYSSSKEGADRVVAEIKAKGGKAIAVQGDVSKSADVTRLFAETKKAYGTFDVLVNNAGVYEFAPARGRDGDGVPSRVQHQRPRPDPDDPGSAEAFRSQGRQRDQHQLRRQHGAGTQLRRLFGHQGRPRHDHPRPVQGARGEKYPGEHHCPGGVETEGTHRIGVIGSDFEKQLIAGTPLGPNRPAGRHRAGCGIPGFRRFRMADGREDCGVWRLLTQLRAFPRPTCFTGAHKSLSRAGAVCFRGGVRLPVFTGSRAIRRRRSSAASFS